MNPTHLIKLTATFNDYNLYESDCAKTVIMIPITQIAAVFVMLSNDLVNASNIFVMLTPPKLKIAILRIPAMAKKRRNPFENTYLI